MQRVLVVPWSSAAAYLANDPSPRLAIDTAVVRSAHAAGEGLSSASQQQVGGGGAGVLMAHAPRAQVAGPALPRFERCRRAHALLGGVGGAAQGIGEARALALRPAQRVDGGQEGVDH